MSKLSRLRDNIAALQEAFEPKNGEYDYEVLEKYSGFGGLGFILNDVDIDQIDHRDIESWNKSDRQYYDDTVRLHELLHKYSNSEQEYRKWMQSLKASVLTAFYTPNELVKAIFNPIYHVKYGRNQMSIAPSTILDPAAGNGVFAFNAVGYASLACQRYSVTAIEKDLLTGLMLGAQKGHAKMQVYVDGFEHFPKDELGMYDLVATNVPFGDINVFDAAYSKSDNKVRRDAAKMIHKYYVLKGLDCLRDGGIEAYIITSNYLNRDGEQLAEVLKQARLIGAYRLANNLFKDAGTEVGTDLLVLQKDSHKQGLTADETFLMTQYEDSGCPTNMYFQMYEDHVIATSWTVDTDAYGKRGFVYMHKDGVKGIASDMQKALAKDLAANLDVALFESDTATHKTESAEKKVQLTAQQLTMLAIHKTYEELYVYEATKFEENTALRRDLNELYDTFVESFGALNKSDNVKALKAIKNHGNLTELLSLEVRDERGRWEKADIFTKPVAFATDDVHGADTPQEALAQSLNDYGKADMKYMSALTGMSEDELLDALHGEVFYNPLPVGNQYEIKAQFICGNVVEKLEQIKQLWPKVAELLDAGSKEQDASHLPETIKDQEELRVYQSAKALQEAIPEPIPFEELDFNLGERWINERVYSAFATEFFNVPGERPSWQSEPFAVEVKYDAIIDQFTASANYSWNEKIGTQYAVKSETKQRYDGMELFIHALHNTCPKLYKYKRDENGDYVYNDKWEKEKEEDPEKTQLANTKIEEIRQGFVDWLLRQPKPFRDELAAIYNRRFNCFVKPKYDGSHQTFPGIDLKGLEKKYGIKHIYGSQKDCVWMLVLNGGGICDHEVGSGKTLIMCMAAHEMKRLGLVHKPMIIGLKANVSAIAETYRTAYPQAKVLYAGAKDYSAKERVDFFNKMKNNDWDCVIMSHDQFSRIPQSQDIELEVMQDEVQQLEDAMNAMEGWDWGNRSRIQKGLERRKRNLEAKIDGLLDAIGDTKDDVVDFNLMGIDHIFVDESHMFKNLQFSTRHDRVAGLGNSEGSKRAFNLLMAIRTIQKRTGKDLGATFLSGTTVTNSLTELYSLFKYLRPKAMAKQNITCFDAWAAIFTKKSQEFEFSITNQIVLKERFRYFIKVPELAMFYNEITDFRTAEDVGIERPEKHARLLNIKPTPDQEDFIKTLMEFAKTGDFSLIGINGATEKQQMAKMLYATDMARKMSLDMRLIDPGYQDHPRSKASRCAYLVSEYYKKFNDVKGTQLVFSDLSAYDPKKWNVYDEIKRKLVEEYGIPADEIRFIQEAKCESKKQKLIDEVNEGKVRVLFGSTQMLGTGVNAQQRVVAVHHLDTPWRPSDLEQRDGRAIRKGNEIAKLYNDNKVEIIIYAVERSLDSYKFNLLHCKQTFINQLKRGQLAKRTLDEGSMEEKGMNFSEYMAILSGNTDLLERAKLEKKIAGLESERKNFLRDQRDQQEKMKSLEEDNERHERHIRSAQGDYDKFLQRKRPDENGFVVNDLTIDGWTMPELTKDGKPMTADDKAKALGERLLQIAATAKTCDIHLRIGEIYGFPVVVKSIERGFNLMGQMEYDNLFFVEGTTLKYSHNGGRLTKVSARQSAENPLQALMYIPTLIEQWQTKMDENNARLEQLKSIKCEAWPKEDELRKLKAELGKLDRKINEELNGGSKKSDKSEGKASDASELRKAA